MTAEEQEDELNRIATRQMQVVDRLDSVINKQAQDAEMLHKLEARLLIAEAFQKRPVNLMERLVIPLMVFNLTLTIGNLAMTLTVAIAVANHILGR